MCCVTIRRRQIITSAPDLDRQVGASTECSAPWSCRRGVALRRLLSNVELPPAGGKHGHVL